MILSTDDTYTLLKKTPASTIVKLSNLSEAYIPQVKHGRRPPSTRLIQALLAMAYPEPNVDYVGLFFKSRSQGVSANTLDFYQRFMGKAWAVARPGTPPSKVKAYLWIL